MRVGCLFHEVYYTGARSRSSCPRTVKRVGIRPTVYDGSTAFLIAQVMAFWQAGQAIDNGKYEIRECIGGGGFGVTYKAIASGDRQVVAIKTLNRNLFKSDTEFDKWQTKFINEAVCLSKCSHPHIVEVREVIREGNLWGMVMDYVEGTNLAECVADKGRLSVDEAIAYIRQAGAALSVVHDKAMLHRDIKPQNIMLRAATGEAILIDFGLAREVIFDQTQTFTNAGTECYAAPEQYQPRTASKRRTKLGYYSDVYALAATLYYLVTAETPLPANFRQQGIPLPAPQHHNPDLDDKVNDAILTGMALEPQDRPQTVAAWLELFAPENNDPIFCFDRGLDLYNLGRNEEAIASYDKALQIKSDYNAVWNNRGIDLSKLGRYEEAIASYDKALQINPDKHESWDGRGVALFHLGRYEEAIASFDKTLQINPSDDIAWYNRGFTLDKLGRYGEAIASWDKVLQIKPDKHEAWYAKAVCYARQNNLEDALKHLQQAIELNPKWRETAKNVSVFDNIRRDRRFRILVGE